MDYVKLFVKTFAFSEKKVAILGNHYQLVIYIYFCG